MASHHLFKNCLRRITLSQYNIEPLQTYKFLQGLSSPLMNEIFVERYNSCGLRGNNVLTRRRVNSVRYGTEAVSFLAPKIWCIIP